MGDNSKFCGFLRKAELKSWPPNRTFFRDFFLERFDKFLTRKNEFEGTNFEMFEGVAHNFGKSDDDML